MSCRLEMLARAIIHAINNAEMRELALRITSPLDFLPLYDVDCRENGNLEYDTYSQPEWKHNLFDLIIWRCFTALKMKVTKNNLAAQW